MSQFSWLRRAGCRVSTWSFREPSSQSRVMVCSGNVETRRSWGIIEKKERSVESLVAKWVTGGSDTGSRATQWRQVIESSVFNCLLLPSQCCTGCYEQMLTDSFCCLSGSEWELHEGRDASLLCLCCIPSTCVVPGAQQVLTKYLLNE